MFTLIISAWWKDLVKSKKSCSENENSFWIAAVSLAMSNWILSQSLLNLFCCQLKFDFFHWSYYIWKSSPKIGILNPDIVNYLENARSIPKLIADVFISKVQILLPFSMMHPDVRWCPTLRDILSNSTPGIQYDCL